MAAAAVPVYRFAMDADIGAGAVFAIVFAVCALAYLLTLRIGFTSAWSDLHALIRTIPDHPKPGIQFRDISTLMLDGGHWG